MRLEGETAARAKGRCTGSTFVVTGSLERWTRNEIESLIKRLGGAVGSSVTKKTDYLVAGENPGSKLTKAAGVRDDVLDEDAFVALLGEKGCLVAERLSCDNRRLSKSSLTYDAIRRS